MPLMQRRPTAQAQANVRQQSRKVTLTGGDCKRPDANFAAFFWRYITVREPGAHQPEAPARVALADASGWCCRSTHGLLVTRQALGALALRHFESKDRHIVLEGGVTAPVAHFAHDGSEDAVKRFVAEALHGVQQARGAEHLAVGAQRVRE